MVNSSNLVVIIKVITRKRIRDFEQNKKKFYFDLMLRIYH